MTSKSINLNYSEFIDITALSSPSEGLNTLMQALWHLRKGHWDEAYNIVQEDPGQYASWIHALLHKMEGDQWNAEYWYRRAGIKNPGISQDEEWDMIVRKLTTAID